MKIALIGYGKMGKAIEQLALGRGHEVPVILDLNSREKMEDVIPANVDVAIEFSQPSSAFFNISGCLRNNVPVISGTTGWLDRLSSIEELAAGSQGAFLHSSNFSLGVNIFFELNKWLADKLATKGFEVEIEEVHHLEKLDSPSGTAIRIAEGIIEKDQIRKDWSNEESTDQTKIGILSKREPNVPGTHSVTHTSPMETIEIKHTAHSRDIFASGAIDVAEWIIGRSGFLTMNDYLNDLK